MNKKQVAVSYKVNEIHEEFIQSLKFLKAKLKDYLIKNIRQKMVLMVRMLTIIIQEY